MEKLTSAVKWGKFNAIFGIIVSILTILSCTGIVSGILMLLAYLKLNNATDALKELAAKAGNTSEEYEGVIEKYGEYLKFLGIVNIISLVLIILAVVLFIIFFGAIMAFASGGNYSY